jgi:hypothetical protein
MPMGMHGLIEGLSQGLRKDIPQLVIISGLAAWHGRTMPTKFLTKRTFFADISINLSIRKTQKG